MKMKILITILIIIILFLAGFIIWENNKTCDCDIYSDKWVQDDLGEWYYDMVWINSEKCKCPCHYYLRLKK